MAHKPSTLVAHRPCHDRSAEHQETAVDLDAHTAPGLSWSFSKISVFPADRASGSQTPSLLSAPPMPAIIQPKLVVGKVNDPLEHEADRIAEQVMRMPGPEVSVAAAPPQISRKCAACEEEEKLQQKPTGPQVPTGEASARVHEAIRSPGQPIDLTARQFFEARFGHDFSRVQVHVGERAAESAQALNALAYTVGTDVVFASGRYEPLSAAGRRLLAHELVHVVQQSTLHPPSGGQSAQRRNSTAPVVTAGATSSSVQRQTLDVGVDRAPVSAGLERPKFADAAAVS
jgi:uncharacterized protein DUF4157